MRVNDAIEKMKCGGQQGFNLWREYYSRLTFEQHKDIINHWYSGPVSIRRSIHRSAHASFFIWAFKQLAKVGVDLSETRVAELGPADGWLAHNCMSKIKFRSWVGYDISRVMVEGTLPEAKNLGFVNIELDKQFWESNVEGFDVFVSAHTIEHLSNNHFEELLNFLSPRTGVLILEIYINRDTRVDWENYIGSHILTFNGNDIDTMIKDRGFVSVGGRYMGWLRHPLTGLHTLKVAGFKRIGLWRNHFTGIYVENRGE